MLTFFHWKFCAVVTVSGFQQPDRGDTDRSLFDEEAGSENKIQRGKVYIFLGISQEEVTLLIFFIVSFIIFFKFKSLSSFSSFSSSFFTEGSHQILLQLTNSFAPLINHSICQKTVIALKH